MDEWLKVSPHLFFFLFFVFCFLFFVLLAFLLIPLLYLFFLTSYYYHNGLLLLGNEIESSHSTCTKTTIHKYCKPNRAPTRGIYLLLTRVNLSLLLMSFTQEKDGESKKSTSRPPSRGGEDAKRKTDKSAKGELALDTIEPPPSAKRSPIKKLKEMKDKRASLPPLPHKAQPDAGTQDNPRLPKIASHDNNSILNEPGSPLFYQRSDSIKARRTYSEQDVRRLRTKARNSVGLEPIT
jgi:hypothetical protein